MQPENNWLFEHTMLECLRNCGINQIIPEINYCSHMPFKILFEIGFELSFIGLQCRDFILP